MKKIILLSIMMLLLAAVVSAENVSYTWTETQPGGAITTDWEGSAVSNNGSVMIIGGYPERLYVSTDTGSSWTEVQPGGDANGDWYQVAVSGDTGQYMYAFDYGLIGTGIWQSNDTGTTWGKIESSASGVQDLEVSDDGQYVYYSNGNTLMMSNDYGVSFTDVSPNNKTSYFNINSNGSRILATTVSGITPFSVFASDDYGTTWSNLTSALLSSTTTAIPRTTSTAISEDGNTLMVGSYGDNSLDNSSVFYSLDGGSTWTKRIIGDSVSTKSEFQFLQVGITKGDVMYYNDVNLGILVSEDYGSSWSQLDMVGVNFTTLFDLRGSDNLSVILYGQSDVLTYDASGRVYIGNGTGFGQASAPVSYPEQKFLYSFDGDYNDGFGNYNLILNNLSTATDYIDTVNYIGGNGSLFSNGTANYRTNYYLNYTNTSDFTLNFWLKSADFYEPGQDSAYIMGGSYGTPFMSVRVANATDTNAPDTMNFRIRNDDSVVPITWITNATALFEDDEWHMVTFVIDNIDATNTTIYAYADGVLKNTTFMSPASITLPESGAPDSQFIIGDRYYGYDSIMYRGNLDEIYLEVGTAWNQQNVTDAYESLVPPAATYPNYTLYDDFETGVFNNTKWNLTHNSPLVSTNFTNTGDYSMFLNDQGRILSATADTLIGETGKYVVSYYAFVEQSSFHYFQNGFMNSSESFDDACFNIFGDYPGSGWGYTNDEGNYDTGISSSSGYANIIGEWLQVKVLVDNDNQKFSVRLGNSTTNDIDSANSSCVVSQIMFGGSGSDYMYVDDIEVWDYDVSGWNGSEIVFPAAAYDPLTDGLVSSYTFDGQSAVDDYGDNNGTLTNTPTWNETIGANNGSYHFNRSQHEFVELPLFGIFDGTDNFSLSAWASADDLSQAAHTILSTWGEHRVMLRADGTTGNLTFVIRFSDANYQITYPYSTTDEWFHIVGTYDTVSGMKMYVNGVDVGNNSKTGAITSYTGGKNTIGTYYISSPGANDWDGYIDEVSIYNKVLNSSDVTSIYSQFTPTNPPTPPTPLNLSEGLLSYYKADDSGSFDDELKLWNGTVTGLSYDSNGKINGAYDSPDFSGNWVDIGLSALPSTGNYSWSMWAYDTGAGAHTQSHYLMHQRGSNGIIQMGVGMDGNNPDALTARVYADGAYTWLYYGGQSSPTAPPYNEWYHVAFTVEEGNEIRFYVNGVLQDNGSIGTINSFADQSYSFAGTSSSSGSTFKGKIDEIGVWTTPLTQEGVTFLYNSGSGKTYNATSGEFEDGPTPSNITIFLDDSEFCFDWEDGTTTTSNGYSTTNVDTTNTTGLFNGSSSARLFDTVADNIITNYSIAKTANFTVRGIYKPTGGAGTHRTIFSSDGGEFGLRCQSTNEFILYLDNYTTSTKGGNCTVGETYHIVMTDEDNTYKVYVDGVLTLTWSDTMTNANPTGNLIITDGSYNTNGVIDDVALWSEVMVQDDVDYDYNSGSYRVCPVVASPPAYVPPTDTLVAHYKMDVAGSTLIDELGNYTADYLNTYGGVSANLSGGIINYGNYFLADNYNTTPPVVSGNFSISFWVNTTSSLLQMPIGSLTSGGVDSDFFYMWMQKDGTSQDGSGEYCDIRFDMRIDSSDEWECIDTGTAPTGNFWNGEFHHVLVTYDDTNYNLSMYYDSTYHGSTILTGTNGYSNADDFLWGGKPGTNVNNAFVGSLDEFSIFNSVLTSDDAVFLYNNASAKTYNATSGEFEDGSPAALEVPPTPYVPPTADLIAYYKVDDLLWSDELDTYNATLTTPLFNLSNGIINYGNKFTGEVLDSSLVDTGINSLGNFTMGMWINTSTRAPVEHLLGTSTGSGDYMYILLQNTATDDDSDVCEVRFSIRADGTEYRECSDATIDDEQWHYVMVTHDVTAKNIKVYVDGVDYGDTTYTGDYSNANNLYLGGGPGSSVDYAGSLDEVAIFNSVLDINDSLYLYNSGSGKTYNVTSDAFENGTGLIYSPSAPQAQIFNETYYKADNSTDYPDVIGSYDVAGANNSATYTASGFINGAYDYDGVSQRTRLIDGSFSTYTEGTINAWVKRNSTGTVQTILGSGSLASISGVFAFRFNADNNLEMVFRDSALNKLTGVKGDSVIVDNQWHMVTVTADDTQAWKLYVDGQEETLTNILGGNGGHWFDELGYGSSQSYFIGAQPSSSPNNFFNGTIDEVYIKNETMNQTEIAYIYNSGYGATHNGTAFVLQEIPPFDGVCEADLANLPCAITGNFSLNTGTYYIDETINISMTDDDVYFDGNGSTIYSTNEELFLRFIDNSSTNVDFFMDNLTWRSNSSLSSPNSKIYLTSSLNDDWIFNNVDFEMWATTNGKLFDFAAGGSLILNNSRVVVNGAGYVVNTGTDSVFIYDSNVSGGRAVTISTGNVYVYDSNLDRIGSTGVNADVLNVRGNSEIFRNDFNGDSIVGNLLGDNFYFYNNTDVSNLELQQTSANRNVIIENNTIFLLNLIYNNLGEQVLGGNNITRFQAIGDLDIDWYVEGENRNTLFDWNNVGSVSSGRNINFINDYATVNYDFANTETYSDLDNTLMLRDVFDIGDKWVWADTGSSFDHEATINFSGLPQDGSAYTVFKDGIAQEEILGYDLVSAGAGYIQITVPGFSNWSISLVDTVEVLSPYDSQHLRIDPVQFNLNTTLFKPYNFTLYINGTANQTVDNYAGSNLNFSVTGLAEGEYVWVVNGTNGAEYVTTGPIDLIVDRTNPIFTLNSLSSDNTSRISRDYDMTAESWDFNDMWSDRYIFAYEHNITHTNGTLVDAWNDTNINWTLGEDVWTNHSVDFSSQPDATYLYTVTGADDHTAAEIPEYDLVWNETTILFVTPTANVTIDSRRMEGVLNVTFEKLQDRYVFGFEVNTTKSTWTFDLTSTEPLYYRGGAYDFPAFVTGEQWVDFNTGDPTTIYEVAYENDYKYELEIETENEQGNIEFQSIGGLNIITEQYEFEVYTQECNGDLSNVPCYMSQDLTLNGGVINLDTTSSSKITIIDDSLTLDGNGTWINDPNTAGHFIDINGQYTVVKNLTYNGTGSNDKVIYRYQSVYDSSFSASRYSVFNDTIMYCDTGDCFRTVDRYNTGLEWHNNEFYTTARVMNSLSGYGQQDWKFNNNYVEGASRVLSTSYYFFGDYLYFQNNILNNTGFGTYISSETSAFAPYEYYTNNTFINGSNNYQYDMRIRGRRIFVEDNTFINPLYIVQADNAVKSDITRNVFNNTYGDGATANYMKVDANIFNNTFIGDNRFQFIGDSSVKDISFEFKDSQKDVIYAFLDTNLWDFEIYNDDVSVQYNGQSMRYLPDTSYHTLSDDIDMGELYVWINSNSSFNNPANITYSSLTENGGNYGVSKDGVIQTEGVDYRLISNTSDSLTIEVPSFSNWSLSLDSDAPVLVSLDENIAEPVAYLLGRSYNFSSVWTDNSSLTVTIELDGVNHSAIDSAPTYYYETELGAGTHTIKWYAEDVYTNAAQSTEYEYEVDIATTNLGLTSSVNWAGKVETSITTEGTGCPSDLTCVLKLDGNVVSNPDTRSFDSAGSFEYEYSTVGNANYTSDQDSDFLDITGYIGGGSGVPPVSREGFKQDCLIDVVPFEVEITDDNLLQKITYHNRENFDYLPKVVLKADGSRDWLSTVDDPVVAGRDDTESFSIVFVNEIFGEYPVNEEIELILSSDNCNDILIPVSINVTDEERVNAVLGNPYTFSNLFKQSLDRDQLIIVALILVSFYFFFIRTPPTNVRGKRLIWRR